VLDPRFAEEVLHAIQKKVREIREKAYQYWEKCCDIAVYLGRQVRNVDWFVFPPEAEGDVVGLGTIKDAESIARKYELLILARKPRYCRSPDYAVVWWRGEVVLEGHAGSHHALRTMKLYDGFMAMVDGLWPNAKVIADKLKAEKIMRQAIELAQEYGIDISRVVEELKSKYK